MTLFISLSIAALFLVSCQTTAETPAAKPVVAASANNSGPCKVFTLCGQTLRGGNNGETIVLKNNGTYVWSGNGMNVPRTWKPTGARKTANTWVNPMNNQTMTAEGRW